MKKYLILTLLIIAALKLEAQVGNKHYLGTHYSYGKAIYSKGTYKLTNNRQYEGKDYFTFGIDYTYRTSETTDLGIGLSGTIVSLYLENTVILPGETRNAHYDESFTILSVPVYLKYHFGKYFYLNPGLSFNYHPSRGYTWGVGGFAGIGFEYTLFSSVSLSIAPQIQLNILSSGKRDNDDYNYSGFEDKVTLIGGKIGIGYKF